MESPIKNMVIVSGLIVAVMVAMSIGVWGQLPAEAALPVHWNALGQPDRYGGKFEGLFLLPLITFGIALLFAFIPRLDRNIMRSMNAYQVMWGMTLILMWLIHGGIIATILGYAFNLTAWVIGAMGVMFGVIGYTLAQIRPNKLFGIRTPWTLASELSWDKTHELGGKLFMLVGLLTTISAFISSLFATFVMVIGLFAVIPVLVVYSYMVYKQDTE